MAVAVVSGALPVLAGGAFNKVTVNSGANVDSMMSGMLGGIVQIFRYVGSALMLWGVGMFFISLKTDDANTKHAGIMCTLAGFMLWSLRWFLQQAGIITG